MNIPDEAVEAAAKVIWLNTRLDPYNGDSATAIVIRHEAALALEAAAPYMLADVERELTDAKRMIALLVLEAGGKVALSRRAITEVSNETVIETTQDVINGGWVIRAKAPKP